MQSKIEFKSILETALAWKVVLAMLAYGVGKYVQFEGAYDPDKIIGELTGMQLMWAFYGYSRPFVLLMGVLEITGAMLLFFKKTRLLGAFFLSSILINVILQDIFYDVNKGALIAACFYQLSLFVIMYLNKDSIIMAIKALIPKVKTNLFFKEKLFQYGMAFLLFLLLFGLEFWMTH
ncbi:MAG: hypothetical protein R2879_14220 [Saprospiraceae bacterium]